MSIDQSPRHASDAPTPARSDTTTRKLDLSVTQVLGGALAAMTAAALGSRLSAGGTIIGAALASVVAAVAGAFYTASLRSTKDKVASVVSRRAAGPAEGWDWPTAAAGPTGAGASAVEPGVEPRTPDRSTGRQVWVERPDSPRTSGRPAGHRRSGSRPSWRAVAAGALLAFGVAGVSLTGLELASGRALSGGDGTTIGQVSRGDSAGGSGADDTDSSPSPTRSPSRTPSSTPTSPAPIEETPAEPSVTPSPSASATPTPSATASPTPSTSAAAPSGNPSTPGAAGR